MQKMVGAIMLFSCLMRLLILLAFSLPTYADKQIRVVADEWSLYTNKDGSGYYFDLIRAAYQNKGYNIQIKHLPFVRATAMLSRGDADVVLGVYSGRFDQKMYSDKPIEMDKVDVVISKSLYSVWQGKETLKNRKVAAKFGYLFNDFFDIDADYQEVRDEESLVKMLLSGRIDAFLDYQRNITPILGRMGVSDNVAVISGVFNPPIFFVFHDSDKGRAMKKEFDDGMVELRRSGKMRELMINNVGDDSRYAE